MKQPDKNQTYFVKQSRWTFTEAKTDPMKTLPTLILAILLPGCASLQQFAQRHSAVVQTVEQVATIAATAAASSYAGPIAGTMASNGLYALSAVLNRYLGEMIPASVVTQTPGVSGVGQAMLGVISTKKPVNEADVATIYAAAASLVK